MPETEQDERRRGYPPAATVDEVVLKEFDRANRPGLKG